MKKIVYIIFLSLIWHQGKTQEVEIIQTITPLLGISPVSELSLIPLDQVPLGTPVTDPGVKFLMKMKAIEDKLYHYNSLVRATETAQFISTNLKELKEQKQKIQEMYDLQKNIRNDLKKVKALKDFGIADVLYLSEQILGESLNPADYMISTDWEFHEDLKRAVSYRPSSMISSDARTVYNFATRYRHGDTLEVRRFDEIASVMGFGKGWRDYRQEQEVTAALAQIRSSEILLDRLKDFMDITVIKDTLSMSDGERLNLMIKYTELMSEVQESKLSAAKKIENVISESLKDRNIRLKKMSREATQQRAFRHIVHLNYNKAKGFRMSDYAVNKEAPPNLANRGMYRVR